MTYSTVYRLLVTRGSRTGAYRPASGLLSVAPCVPPETEADPVQRLFCQLNLPFDGLLVLFRL